jgi:ankyrin repeat protein
VDAYTFTYGADNEQWTKGSEYMLKRVQDLMQRQQPLTQMEAEGKTPLFLASLNGHSEVVARLLLAAGADPNQTRTNDGATLLYVASENGHSEVVGQLLLAGADANQPTHSGVMPLHVAAIKGHRVVVARLLSGGAQADAVAKTFTALDLAERAGHAAVAELLRRACMRDEQD